MQDIVQGGSSTIEYVILSDNPKSVNTMNNTWQFEYTVDDPNRGPVNFAENTNEVSITMISNRLSVVKTVDKAYATARERLHYTSRIENTGTLEKINMMFYDPIPTGTSFTAGSVRINGTSYPAYNPAMGFPIGNMAVGAGGQRRVRRRRAMTTVINVSRVVDDSGTVFVSNRSRRQ